jgi:Ca2+-binding RTX toxin-like protein
MLMVATMAITVLVASGVALAVTKIGTNGPDFLKGTNGDDTLIGKGGNDKLFAWRGNDNLLGGTGKDWLFGGTDRGKTSGGQKNMVGGPGNDRLQGGKGSDNLVGERGNDLLIDGDEPNPKKDTLSSGDGNDALWVWNRPAGRDVGSCGSGFDRVLADRDDLLLPDCEKVFIGERKIDAWVDSIPESFWEGQPI